MTRIGFFIMAGGFSGFLFGMFFPIVTASIGALIGGAIGCGAGFLLDKSAAQKEDGEQ